MIRSVGSRFGALLVNTDRNALLGHSDNNAAQDVGRLKATYQSNGFDGTVQRNPRVRFGEPVHVFNNYYPNVSSYGVASQRNAGVLVEGNFFENTRRPTRNDVNEFTGRVMQRQNMFVNSDPSFSSGTVMEPSSFYNYTLTNPNDIPNLVRAGAGVRLQEPHEIDGSARPESGMPLQRHPAAPARAPSTPSPRSQRVLRHWDASRLLD